MTYVRSVLTAHVLSRGGFSTANLLAANPAILMEPLHSCIILGFLNIQKDGANLLMSYGDSAFTALNLYALSGTQAAGVVHGLYGLVDTRAVTLELRSDFLKSCHASKPHQ